MRGTCRKEKMGWEARSYRKDDARRQDEDNDDSVWREGCGARVLLLPSLHVENPFQQELRCLH